MAENSGLGGATPDTQDSGLLIEPRPLSVDELAKRQDQMKENIAAVQSGNNSGGDPDDPYASIRENIEAAQSANPSTQMSTPGSNTNESDGGSSSNEQNQPQHNPQQPQHETLPEDSAYAGMPRTSGQSPLSLIHI